MTKSRIREVRAFAENLQRLDFRHQGISISKTLEETLSEIERLQSFTRRGESPEELPHKANELPLAAKVNLKKRARGTVQELQAFAKEHSMPASDGEFLFHHFEGKGWKDVLDWKAHFRKWKSANWLPSQKGQNGKPVNREAPGVTL